MHFSLSLGIKFLHLSSICIKNKKLTEMEKKVLDMPAGQQETQIKLTDYMTIRRDRRIMGSIVGTCATKGWSANDCTMPIELTPWETRLLIEEGLAVCVSKKQQLLTQYTQEELQNYQEQLEERINQQEETLRNKKMKETKRNLDKVMAGKRKKLHMQGMPEEEINLNPQAVLDEIRSNIDFNRQNALLDIPCAYPDTHDFFKVNIWAADNTLKYLVFRDFWSRGKYVTCGDAFGADFLIYPGDPLQYHASHTVVLLDDSKIRGLDLVAKVRLSVTVNKLCVLAYFENDRTTSETNNITITGGDTIKRRLYYQTISWMRDKDKERRMAPK